MNEDTIAAIATATGAGGIGIVRISGPMALSIAQRLFKPAHWGASEERRFRFKPHYLHYGRLYDPNDDCPVDEVLVGFMPGPHSYTREDVVELQTHGGAGVLKKILELTIKNGARAAEPGEFTRRAFVNGRIDLSQAEAVADIINADSEAALRMAAQQLCGGLKERVGAVLDEIELLTADMLARIDFPDDIDGELDPRQIEHDLLHKIIGPLSALRDSFEEGRIRREGLKVVITGRPNVGKSSLLNRLIGAEKAIVTEIAGTTRDTVEGDAGYKGIPMRFIDTAGIHDSRDPIESIGIQKAQDAIESAELVILMIDATDACNFGDKDVFQRVKHKETLVAINKIDRVDEWREIRIPPHFGHIPKIFVSASEGVNIDALKEKIADLCMGKHVDSGNDFLVGDIRHKNCLDESLDRLNEVVRGLEGGVPEDMLVSDLELAGDALKKITGDNADGDVLDRIFERFCIGK